MSAVLGTLVTVLGVALLVLGGALCAVAAVGVVRLPDALLRMNAVTKASSLGVVSILAGVAVLDPSWRSVLVLACAAVFLLVTAPVAGHVLGHSTVRDGAPLAPGTRVDDLPER